MSFKKEAEIVCVLCHQSSGESRCHFFFFRVSHTWSETLQKQMPCLSSLLILFRFFSPLKSPRKSFLFMKREKNAYFLIKACSVCFSITQHMSDQQHWWAHQTKKHLRLAPPPELWFVEEPPPLMSGSLIWTLFQTLIYPEKAYWARFPLFHQRLHWYSYVSSCSHLGAARWHHRLVSSEAPLGEDAALLKRTSAVCF